MLKYVRSLSIFALVSGCGLLLSACGGSGSVQPTATNITAHTSEIPDSVYSGSASTVSIALTASTNSWGTAKVQLVDVGSATPQIDCGTSQTLGIGGRRGTFTCQAPQANLGSSNEHLLQVEVNGKSNLPSSVPVYVVNGGRVYATLTSTSGAPIEDADPGETFDVLFSADSSRREVAGQYTVTAPGGWQVGGDNGACTIDVNSPTSCEVPVTVPAAASAATYGLELAKAEGSSLLSPYLLPLTVEGLGLGDAAGGGGCGDDCLQFYLAQNISDTLYTGSQFHYHSVFLFKNTSGHKLKITSVSAPTLATVTAGVVEQPSLTAAYALATPATTYLAPFVESASNPAASGPLYAVSGYLPTNAPDLSTRSVAVTVLDGTVSLSHPYHTVVTFVPYVGGKLAVRLVVPPATAPASVTIHVAATIKRWVKGAPDVMVSFTPVSAPHTYYTGVISTAPAASYTRAPGSKTVIPGEFLDYQINGSKGHDLLFYMPHGQSGVIYFNLGKIDSTSPPTHTGSATPPRWLRVEFTYGGPRTAPAPYTTESLYADQSYVDAITVMGQVNVMGKLSPLDLLTQNNTRGINSGHFKLKPNHKQSTAQRIFNGMLRQFNDQNDSFVWGFDCKRQGGLQNYVRKGFPNGHCPSDNSVTGIIAPIAVSPLPVQSFGGVSYCLDPMRAEKKKDSAGNCSKVTSYYKSYIDSLWTYLKTYPIYIRTTFADDPAGTGLPDCIVKGQVKSDDALVFTRASGAGTCPMSKGPNGSNTVASLKMTKFLPCDFLEAAGSSSCHLGLRPEISKKGALFPLGLYGATASYRAAVGEVLAAFQAAGLLPMCPAKQPPFYPAHIQYAPPPASGTPLMDRRTARAAIADKMAYQNPTCLPGVSSKTRPLWNVYADILGDYDNVYNYSYGDFLGLSGTVTFAPPAGTASRQWFDKLGGVAQPITVTIK